MIPGVLNEESPATELAEPAAPGATTIGGGGPGGGLASMVGLYCLMFGFLVYRQHSNFATFGFDIGIHDQGIWLASRGRSTFVTVRGLDYFAHHVNLISMV